MAFNTEPPVTIAIVFAGLLVIGVAANVSNPFAGQAAPENATIGASPGSTLADQEKCTEQADSFYEREGARLSRKETTRGYINQYSPKLGKCFITIIASEYSLSSLKFSFYKMSIIINAVAGTLYGTYSSSKRSIPPEYVSECWVTRESGKSPFGRSQAQMEGRRCGISVSSCATCLALHGEDRKGKSGV